MKPDLLDDLILLGSNSNRSTDCIVVVKLKNHLSPDKVKEGAETAQKLFPKTGKFPVKITSDEELDVFLNSSLDSHFHLELALFKDSSIGLKMSHYLGDAVSMLLWLKALSGEEVSTLPIKLKSFPAKKDTPYRKFFNSDIWPRKMNLLSEKRGIIHFTMTHSDIPESFSLNDIFILSLLDSLKFTRRSIWIPVNVREKFLEGFGNGLSRLRVYPPAGNRTEERLQNIRKQKIEAFSNGEVSLPPEGFDLSTPLKKTLFKMWLHRPWADWGSLSLSHLSDFKNDFREFEYVQGISNIMPRHQGVLFAFSRRDITYFSFTYDALNVSVEEVDKLILSFVKRTGEIMNDLLL